MENKFAKKRSGALWRYKGTKGRGDGNEETRLGLKSKGRIEYYNSRGIGARGSLASGRQPSDLMDHRLATLKQSLILQWSEM